MDAMGLSEYCLDINDLQVDRLIQKFWDLEMNANDIKPLIKEKTGHFREALAEQYEFIFRPTRTRNKPWVTIVLARYSSASSCLRCPAKQSITGMPCALA